MKLLKSVLFMMIFVYALSLNSCHQPLTELLIAAIEDDYDPVIVITAPSSGDTYYSFIDVAGYVNDDSLSSGDDKGLIRSISFVVANDLDHKGKIDIDAQGNEVQDTVFGNIPIDYDKNDRSFSFSVPTSDLGYPPLTLYLQIYVVDFNGNESAEILQLQRSEGPYIDLTHPMSNGFVLDENITIQGTVADSIRRTDQAGEVATLKLEILSLGISAVLSLSNPGTGVPLITRPGTFNYDPALRTFQTFLYLDSSSDFDKNITSMVINVIATDLNGNVTTVTRTMTQVPDQGPTISVSTPQESGTYFYSGASPASPILWVNDTGTNRTPYSSLRAQGYMFYPFPDRRIATAQIQLAGSTINLKTHPNTIHYGPDVDPLTGFYYAFDYYIFDVTYSESTIRSFVGDGSVNLTLTAIDDDPEMRTSVKSWQLKEDSSGPLFSAETAVTDSGNAYVGDSNTISLSFRLNDGAFETGINLATLAGTVGGLSVTETDFGITPVSAGIYDCTLDIDVSTLAQGAGTVSVSITASDHIGNPTTINQGDFDQLITYMPGAPSLTTRTVNAGGDQYAAGSETITVNITSDQPLKYGPTVDIGGNSVVAVGGPTNWTATTTNPVNGEGIVSLEFSDIVNILDVPSSPATVSGVTAGSLVSYYPGAPELENVAMSLEDSGHNSKTGNAAVGDFIVLEFDVLNDRVLDTTPTVAFTYGPPDTPLQGTLSSTYSDPGHYRFELEIVNPDHLIEDNVDYSIDFRDAAGNDGTIVTGSSSFVLYTP